MQGRCITFLPRPHLASRLGAAPSQQSFGDSAAPLVPGLFKLRVESAECRMGHRKKIGIMSAMKHQNLQKRTKQFALQVIKFCEGPPHDDTSKILGKQLLRAGCSVGANYRAAQTGGRQIILHSSLPTLHLTGPGTILHSQLFTLHLNCSRPMPFQQRTNTSW